MRLFLLVPTDLTSIPTVEANNQHWGLQPVDLPPPHACPTIPYTCVSYTWGPGREPSPFRPSFPVSDRTVPALETFARHRPSSHGVWIDAFCVPLDEPERTDTLQSMGYIYAHAAEVLVVLSAAAAPALRGIQDTHKLTISDLAVLEQEEWVSRAWTYQETVNNDALFFTCEGNNSVVVPVEQFLNRVGEALVRAEGSWMDKLRMYPRLNAFEDIILDYRLAGFAERAALNIMSNMDRRVQVRAEDHFYAMMGAISAERASGDTGVHACEAFMRVCEKKGDFSFIYSAAEREPVRTRRWRPVVGDLPSILPWSGWGTGQPGRLCDEGLWLDKVLVLRSEAPQPAAEKYVQEWLTNIWRDYLDLSQHTWEENAYGALKQMGFSGSSKWVSVGKGFFFPWRDVEGRAIGRIVVSTTVAWRMGCPGLLEYVDGDGEVTGYDAGVFVGDCQAGEPVSVLIG